VFNEFYKCDTCGKMVEVVKDGGGTLVCCDKPMEKLIPNTVDAALEKHVPVIEYNDGGVLVKVGTEPHPMIDVHYIEWIEISYGTRKERKHLNPGDKPEAAFKVESKDARALIYCNLHGLWASAR
jgi:superoxide reductase